MSKKIVTFCQSIYIQLAIKAFLSGINFKECLSKFIMRNLIYIVAVELMIAWLLGFFVFGGGPYFHILLALAIVLTLTRISTNNTLTRKE